ncbi:MAG: hypothetical protein HFE90_09405 [Firmicutes bacterium]|nr:hypothetical protein [Bacillota bacterium]
MKYAANTISSINTNVVNATNYAKSASENAYNAAVNISNGVSVNSLLGSIKYIDRMSADVDVTLRALTTIGGPYYRLYGNVSVSNTKVSTNTIVISSYALISPGELQSGSKMSFAGCYTIPRHNSFDVVLYPTDLSVQNSSYNKVHRAIILIEFVTLK